MKSCRFPISNWRENKFCSHEQMQAFHFGKCLHDIISPEMKFHFCQNDRNEITPAVSFKRTCTFISLRVNFVHMRISCRFEISFRLKWPIWNPYWFQFHFASIHVDTVKSWLNTIVKSHTRLSSFRLSFERILKYIVHMIVSTFLLYFELTVSLN